MILMLIAFITFIIFGWTYIKNKRLNYWARKGVGQLKGTNLLYGDDIRLLKYREPPFDVAIDQYMEFKKQGARFGGKYDMLSQPSVYIIDPELIKQILVRDSDHFMDHGLPNNPKLDIFSGNLFDLKNDEWKNLRQKLSPTFSPGKIKTMFQILQICATSLTEALNVYAENKEPVDIHETLARFTTDIIGNCAFGIECNSLKDPDAEFRYYGKKIFESRPGLFEINLMRILPYHVSKLFGLRVRDMEVDNFFMNMVKSNAEYREKNKVIRNDFFQLLLQLKSDGRLDDDEHNHVKTSDVKDKLTLQDVAAQCFVFFVAGYDTSSNTMTFTLYELAVNQDIQDKLRKDINDVLKLHDGEIGYDAIQEMGYLDKVVNESMRKYSLAATIHRRCTKKYKIPDSDVVIEKGIKLQIPVSGLHRDPEYYPDPLKFDPERFSKENIESRPPMTFLPFGEGPRQCIGTRFGLMQTKIGIATIIKNFKVTVNKEKSDLPLKFRLGLVSSPKDIYLNIENIK